ncbi:response regulator transcription factor [Amycolatopsis sp. CA-230715]|uniref:response regulator transcription factor n=1 Tax=Amycolatopsis sp. CA-230715 TaxID=2745196 RepID=UPI001C012A70|nr:response regulator transcription factor [Amycolatopsis sp. CA-230715]QWF77907.1 Sensory transduction protein regX3 [Amycolatopsis sp. CA-230715]
MRTRLLLVEDDELISQALGMALRDEDFDVVEVPSGERALEVLTDTPVDVVLLDLMLPGIDGLEVCRRLRTDGTLPIIVITARTASDDIIAGLEAGADDYVTKPLVAAELTARIRALLRRSGPTRRPVTAVAGLELRPDEETLFRDGTEIHLTRTEFRLLAELAANADTVVTREQLLRRVWEHEYFGDTRLLDVHIRRLRRKIEPAPDTPSIILTVRGIGYKMAAQPSTVDN